MGYWIRVMLNPDRVPLFDVSVIAPGADRGLSQRQSARGGNAITRCSPHSAHVRADR